MKAGNQTTGVRLRVVLAPGIALGPGKADLLEAISEAGSISAAGRHMTMSYKRAWTLVDDMNGWFCEPLVETGKGGAGGGGARLTALGETVLKAYRRMEKAAGAATEPELTALRTEMADIAK